MPSPNSMIVRGQALPAPPLPLQRFFGGGSSDRSRGLSVAGLDLHFALHPEASPFATIGRSEDCDVQLDHPDVSFRHAHLQLVAGHIYCIDLASRTGTFWDGINLPSGWLMPGQAVRIGPFSIVAAPDVRSDRLQPVDVRSDRLQPVEGPAEAGHYEPDADRRVAKLNLLSHEIAEPRIELQMLNGRHLVTGKRQWTVRQPITLIGSGPQCRLRLQDDSVSRVHCSLMATPAGVWVTDLLGRDGTWVNGERVTFQLLNDDDVLEIGRFEFRVRYRNEEDDALDVRRDRLQPVKGPAEAAHYERAGGGGVSESFVLSMMDRFLEMQQQMSAMNHQQMMFMAQLIESMQQNHHEVVQRELARIEEVGAEIRKLQEQVAAQGWPIPPGPPPLNVEEIVAAALSRQKHLESPPAVDSIAEPQAGPMAEAACFRADAGSVGHAVEAAGFRTDVPDPTPTASPPRFTPHDVNSHSHLIERMAVLEKERSSRWKKLVGMLTGSGP